MDELPNGPTEATEAALASALSDVLSPITLPCSGRTMSNKLVKVAMYEHLASMYGGPPNPLHLGLYKTWGQGSWGMLVTGNVQVSKKHLTLGRDIVVPSELTEEDLRPFRALASVMHGRLRGAAEEMTCPDATQRCRKSLAILQLNHGGRQSCQVIGGRWPSEAPLAPSPIRVTGIKEGMLSDLFHRLLFQSPKEMSLEEIDEVVKSFIRGAKLAWKSGFDGVELHSAHGYLLSGFLSPKTNKRRDMYSAYGKNALRLLKRILDGIKEVVPDDFVLGIKINSADYVNSQMSSDEAYNEEKRITEHITSIAKWGVLDFIEISGGNYESPTFVTNVQRSRRQAFFSQFSHHIVKTLELIPARAPKPLVLLTGGLRTPSLLCDVLSSRHTDLLGIGRGSLLRPDLPLYLQKLRDASRTVRDPIVWDSPFEREPDLENEGFYGWVRSKIPRISIIGAGVEMAWYCIMMRRLGTVNAFATDVSRPLALDYDLGAIRAVIMFWFWTLGSLKDT